MTHLTHLLSADLTREGDLPTRVESRDSRSTSRWSKMICILFWDTVRMQIILNAYLRSILKITAMLYTVRSEMQKKSVDKIWIRMQLNHWSFNVCNESRKEWKFTFASARWWLAACLELKPSCQLCPAGERWHSYSISADFALPHIDTLHTCLIWFIRARPVQSGWNIFAEWTANCRAVQSSTQSFSHSVICYIFSFFSPFALLLKYTCTAKMI